MCLSIFLSSFLGSLPHWIPSFLHRISHCYADMRDPSVASFLSGCTLIEDVWACEGFDHPCIFFSAAVSPWFIIIIMILHSACTHLRCSVRLRSPFFLLSSFQAFQCICEGHVHHCFLSLQRTWPDILICTVTRKTQKSNGKESDSEKSKHSIIIIII